MKVAEAGAVTLKFKPPKASAVRDWPGLAGADGSPVARRELDGVETAEETKGSGSSVPQVEIFPLMMMQSELLDLSKGVLDQSHKPPALGGHDACVKQADIGGSLNPKKELVGGSLVKSESLDLMMTVRKPTVEFLNSDSREILEVVKGLGAHAPEMMEEKGTEGFPSRILNSDSPKLLMGNVGRMETLDVQAGRVVEVGSSVKLESLDLMKTVRKPGVQLFGVVESVKPKDAEVVKGLGAHARPEMKEEGKATEDFPSWFLNAESLELSMGNMGRVKPLDVPVAYQRCYSRIYPLPKRRRISAVRDFPVGFVRNASMMNGDGPCVELTAKSLVGSSTPTKKRVMEMTMDDVDELEGNCHKAQVRPTPVPFRFDGARKPAVILETTEKVCDQVKRNDSMLIREKAREITSGAQFSFASKRSPDEKTTIERRRVKFLARPISETRLEGYDEKKISGNFPIEKPRRGRPPLHGRHVFGSRVLDKQGRSIGCDERKTSRDFPIEKARRRGRPPLHAGPKFGSNVADEQGWDLSIEDARNGIFEGYDEKKISGDFPIEKPRRGRPPLYAKPKFGSQVVDKQGHTIGCDEKRISRDFPIEKPRGRPPLHAGPKFVADKQDSTIGRDEKKMCRNLSIEDARNGRLPLDKIPLVDKEGSSSEQKLVIKGPTKHGMEAKVVKWKSLEEMCIKRGRTEGGCASEDYGVGFSRQALTADPNCSQRLISKPGTCLVPKNVNNKGKSQSIWYEEYGRGLTIYKNLCESSSNNVPLVPPKLTHKDGYNDAIFYCDNVKRALRLFQLLSRDLLDREDRKLPERRIKRVDLMTSNILRDNMEWVNTGKPIIGHVPGVEVGDEFHYRVELAIVGLHHPFVAGIDSVEKGGVRLATSIVSSGGYSDIMDGSDVLIYCGSGGNPSGGKKQEGDQKLERGNLALKNSIYAKTPVRVIHGIKEMEKSKDSSILSKKSKDISRAKLVSTFTYDGLYLVESYDTVKHDSFSVFNFQLRRVAGQPELALKEVRRTRKAKVREGLCIEDISVGKERMPICAVNRIDAALPRPFEYTIKNKYPWYIHPPSGCDCTDGCLNSNACACAAKNGGKIPFNGAGAIFRAKPLVYECGPSCMCPPSCSNRVSQHGIKIQLEIYKTKSRGWGVRSLNSIPSGSFICEYIGELLKDTEAEMRDDDEYLFDIGQNYEDTSLWEGLETSIPGLHSSSSYKTVEDVCFTIDAATYGNVGRFVNHSCSPNLYAQNVLYDHDNIRMPHVMFFAADNIPPLQELTYHYNYNVGQVCDAEGNIKQKSCHCGSQKCTGRLY